MSYPADRKYTKQHEWIKVVGQQALVGITDHAQEALGDIVFVDLPKVGQEMKEGSTFGTVESVKAVSDLYAPATGTVTEVNQELATSPEQVNQDPHGSWMLKMTLKDPGALADLLSSTAYDQFVAEEAGH
jgi:glycine cleavage system H protein